MKRGFDHIVAEVCSRWTAAVAGRPALALLAVLAATAAVGTYTTGNLGVNADINQMFSDEVHYRALEIAYAARFPAVTENVLVVLDGDTPERARNAAAVLAERMRGRPDLFHDVFLPQGPFFEDHALLYMGTDELEDFADRMARVQPYLAGLARDGTLRGLTTLLARGVDAVRDGDVAGEELVPMLERFSAAAKAWHAGDAYEVSWAEIVAGRELAADARRRFVLARPVLSLTDLVAAEAPLLALRRLAEDLGIDEAHGVRMRVTGEVALSYEEMQLVSEQAAQAGVLSFVLVGAILLIALRSLRLLLSTLVALVVGLIWSAGFAALAIGHLNVISVAFAVLFIGLSVDFSIHYCLRYQELAGAGRSVAEALSEAARGVGPSIALCAVTTSIGFYAFVPTDFAGVAELGLISGTAMYISVLATFTVLPALISVGTRAGQAPTRLRSARRFRSLPAFPVRHPWPVATVALLLALAGLAVLPQAYFDADPLRVRDPSAESVQTYEELVAAGGTSPLDISVIAPDLGAAEALAQELQELKVVDRAITVSDFVPADQAQKLAIIEDVALFLAPPPAPDGTTPAPSLSQQLEALRSLEFKLTRLLDGAAGDASLDAAAAQVRDDLTILLGEFSDVERASAGVAALERSLLASLPDQLEMLDRAVSVGPVTVDHLPAGLLDRMVSHDGAVRVRIFPSEDLSDNAALARFVADVRTVTPDATGSAVNVYEASREAVRALRQALGTAVVVIAVLLFLIWRTIGDTLLVMTPLVLAGVLTGAGAVLAGIPFNFADIIVLPLLLGIGVDSGIHLVERSRAADAAGAHLLETSTAHAVLFSALTTIASFGSLGLAGHLGIATMGRLLTIGVGLALACNLLLLPALIQFKRRRAAAGA